jgi:hypothetical protein
MGSLLDWLLKALIVLLLAPIVVGLALHFLGAVLAILLPWLIVLAVIAGSAAGVTAGLILRRRLPPRPGRHALPPDVPPLGPHRVRRPRGGM